MSGEPMDIDDYRPISSGGGLGAYDDAFDGGEGSNKQVVDNRPLSVRIGDKNWKTRLTAYEDLKRELQECSEGSDLFEEYSSWIPKMTADSNVGALDAGVDAALVFAERCPQGCLVPYYDKLFANVVDKAFAGKPSTITKGKALLLKLIEVDEAGPCALYLISRLSDKKPKVPPTCLEVIKEGIIAFGARPFPLKEVFASLGPVLDGNNSAAREQALQLMLELTKWVGKSPLAVLLESLRPAQKSEFEKLLSELEAQHLPPPLPTVYLRKSRPAPGTVVAPTARASNQMLDGREFVEEIDLVKKLKSTDYSTLVNDEKWSEQLRGLQILVDALGPTPKIKSGPGTEAIISDINSTLKNFLVSGHIQVQTTALKLYALLADGLRGDFTSTARPIAGLVLSKSKEKRLTAEALSALYSLTKHCLPSVEVLMEDLLDLIKNKKNPPHARICAMEYLAAASDSLPKVLQNGHLKPLVEALLSVCDDSDPKVRDACAITLAAFVPLISNRGKPALESLRLIQALEQSNPRVFAKIMATIEGGDEAPPPSKPAAVAPPPAPAPAQAKRPSTAPSNAQPSASSNGTTAPKKTSAPSGASKSAPTASAAADDENVEDLSMSPEEAEQALAALNIPDWESTFQENISSAKWQDKVEALNVLADAVQSSGLGAKFSAAVVTYLGSKTSNFKISNISIAKAVLSVGVELAASAVGSTDKFSRPAAWELLKHFSDKLSDKKTADQVSQLLTNLSEANGLSLSWVVKRMKSLMDKLKAPAPHQAYLEWLKGAVIEFGAGAVPVRDVVAFCHIELENKAVGVRTAAVEVVGQLFHQIGPKFQSIVFADDIKPQVKSLLEAEFEKVTYDPTASSRATRGPFAGGVASTQAGNGGASSAAAAGGGMDIPRLDLAAALDKNILSELSNTEGKTSWQNRKAAMEAITAACEKSGHYIDASSKASQEIVKSLKARLSDTQANLKPIAATTIGHVISSLESDQALKLFRGLVSGMLGGLQENKKAMRDSTIQALTVCVTLGRDKGPAEGTAAPASGTPSLADSGLLGCVIGPAAEALMNPVGRQELLQFLVTHSENLKAECSEVVPSAVACLQDKTAAVRALSEQLLMAWTSKSLVTKTAVDKATRDLPQAVKRTLQTLIDKLMANFGRPVPLASIQSAPQSTSVRNVKELTTQQSFKEVASEKEFDEKSGYSVGSARWFLKKTSKLRRLEDFYKINWPAPPEVVGDNELAGLKAAWEPVLSPDLAAVLFGPATLTGSAKNQDAFMSAMNELTTQIDAPHALMHTDLMLRYAAYILCVRETSVGMLRVCQLIGDIFALFSQQASIYGGPSLNSPAAIAAGVVPHDSELATILPHLLERSGHKSERHRQAIRAAIQEASRAIVPTSRFAAALIQGLASPNKKSRVVCIEELQKVAEDAINSNGGSVSVGVTGGLITKAGMKELGTFMEAKDTDMQGKQAALELFYTLYIGLNSDLPKLIRLLGGTPEGAGGTTILGERSVSMIEDRIKLKLKSGSAPTNQAPERLASPTRGVGRQMSFHSHSVATAAAVAAAAAEIDAMDISAENNDTEDAGNVPFKLDMTPTKTPFSKPAIVTQSSVNSIPESLQFKMEKTPSARTTSSFDSGQIASPTRPSTPRESTTPKATSEMAQVYGPEISHSLLFLDTSLSGVHADIVEKIDAYLFRAYLRSDDSDLMGKLSLRESALDYLKILHEMAVGQWYQAGSNGTPDEVQVPPEQLESIILRLTKCIAVGFERPIPSKTHPDLQLDVNVLSVAMATLFQFFKRGVGKNLSLTALISVFKVCLGKLVDARLVKDRSELSEGAFEMGENITKGLNMIALRLAEDANNDVVIRALLKVLLECALSEQAAALGQNTPATALLSPPDASQPASRLLLHVLSDEVSTSAPFAPPEFDLKKLLGSLHEFYVKHPLIHVENDRPFRAAKTILNETVKALGGHAVLSTLVEMEIPTSAFIVKLTAKLGNVSAPEVSPDLNARVISLIDEITSARDKIQPIRQLYALHLEHPELELSTYLRRISSTFRRFVIDTLVKLGADVPTTQMPNSPPATQPSSSDSAEAPAAAPSNSSKIQSYLDRNSLRSNTADEALRILEGLKSANRNNPPGLLSRGASMRQSFPLAGSPLPNAPERSPVLSRLNTPGNGVSPRTQISDKVRGSLNDLTASLGINGISERTYSDASMISSNSKIDDDLSDLSLRVSKLVSHFNK